MENYVDAQHLRRLLAALRSLPVRQQAIFVALVDEDVSYATLAVRFGTDVADIERDFVCALVALDAVADG